MTHLVKGIWFPYLDKIYMWVNMRALINGLLSLSQNQMRCLMTSYLSNIFCIYILYIKTTHMTFSFYKSFIYFILFFKIVYISLALIHLYVVKKTNNKKLATTLAFWKEQCDFIFSASMAILIIYLFYPFSGRNTVTIDSDSAFLLYAFGFVLIITANWSAFFGNSILLNDIQDIFRRR